MNGMPRSSKSPLPRRLISAYAEGDLSDLILGQRRIASFIIRYKQRGLDLFGPHTAPAHRSRQSHQCVVAMAFRNGAAYRCAPVRTRFVFRSQQPQEPLGRFRDRRRVLPAVPLAAGVKRLRDHYRSAISLDVQSRPQLSRGVLNCKIGILEEMVDAAA